MFIVQHFLLALAQLVEWVLWAYLWLIIIRSLISWVSPDPWNPVVQFLIRVTEPVLGPIRRRLPMGAGLDFSPMVAILAIWFLEAFLPRVIREAAFRLSAG